MSITCIIGPMFSGKTTELIRLVDRKTYAGRHCLIIKHDSDTRFDPIQPLQPSRQPHVTTHGQICYQKTDIIHLPELTQSLIDDWINTKQYDVIAIEEGHFFPGIHTYCVTMANAGIDVIVSALDSSFKQELFVETGKLIANSENVIKLSAICMLCKGADGHFTIRTIDNDDQILVGGADIYMSVCRKCLINFKKNSSKHTPATFGPIVDSKVML